jgi:hypothetical protein
VFVLGEEVWIAENVVWKGKFSYVRDLELGGELWRRRHRVLCLWGSEMQKGCHELVNRMRMPPHVSEPSYSTLDFARERSLHFRL